jgi:hypothetical protein
MKMSIEVAVLAPDGSEAETYTVEARTPDVIRWEKVHQEPWYESKNSVEQGSELAYYAARRIGKFAGTLEDWLATVDVDTKTEEPVDPTQPSPGDGS